MADLASLAEAYRASLRPARPLGEVWSAAGQAAKPEAERSRSASSDRSKATSRLSRSSCFTASARVRARIRPARPLFAGRLKAETFGNPRSEGVSLSNVQPLSVRLATWAMHFLRVFSSRGKDQRHVEEQSESSPVLE